MPNLTISQLADQEGVSREAIHSRIRRGKLQANKVPSGLTPAGFYWQIPWPQPGEKEEAKP